MTYLTCSHLRNPDKTSIWDERPKKICGWKLISMHARTCTCFRWRRWKQNSAFAEKKCTRDNKVHLMTLCTTVMGERFMITHKRLYSFYHDWLVKIDWTRHDRAICRQMTTSTITIRRFYTTEIQNAILRDRSSKLADLFLDIWPIYLPIVSMIKVLECQTRGSAISPGKKGPCLKRKVWKVYATRTWWARRSIIDQRKALEQPG